MNNNNNLDKDTIDNIKNMVDNGDISSALSQISPEMIQNFSKILSENSKEKQSNNTEKNSEDTSNSETEETTNNINLNNIDINSIMKMSSMLGNMNNSKNDPRANLLNSLKPYLRDSKKGKLDNYMNMLNISKIAEIMKKNNNKEN